MRHWLREGAQLRRIANAVLFVDEAGRVKHDLLSMILPTRLPASATMASTAGIEHLCLPLEKGRQDLVGTGENSAQEMEYTALQVFQSPRQCVLLR